MHGHMNVKILYLTCVLLLTNHTKIFP